LGELGYVWLCLVGSTVRKICLVFHYIPHTAYIVDARALTSILPSVSLKNMAYCAMHTKRRRRWFRTSASIFSLICLPHLHNVLSRVRNRSARFHSVFVNADVYDV
jgi:hypothetical protein